MSEREKAILRALLKYCHANLDDINDTYAFDDSDDEHNESGRIQVGSYEGPSIMEDEVNALAVKLICETVD